MEDSFRVRADKVFGSLGGGDKDSSVGVSSSLWCLGDEEIERREWLRNKDLVAEEGDVAGDSRPSGIRNPIVPDLQDLSDCEEEEEEEEEEDEEEEEIDDAKKKRRRNNSSAAETIVDEYFDVQSNIGRDCTLDLEDEEDQYDKVAVGSEQTGDRLYMRDIKSVDYENHELVDYGELPNTFKAVVRDPRANLGAAKTRLKEDDEAAGNFDTPQTKYTQAEDHKIISLDGCDNLKPILKRRENQTDSKSQRRVRFSFDLQSSTQASEPCESEASDVSLYSPGGVPDYLVNPSKYTRYAFDSSDDMNDQSNIKACMDFLRKGNSEPSMDDMDMSAENSKAVVFTPRKITGGGLIGKRGESTGDNVAKNEKRWSVGIITAEEENQESEISAMEEDEPCRTVDQGRGSQRTGRQYRARVGVDVDDNSN